MKDFEIGGKITLSETEKYVIVDIVEYEKNKYYFCSTINKPIVPVIFERKEIDGKTFVKQVNDSRIIQYITSKILKE